MPPPALLPATIALCLCLSASSANGQLLAQDEKNRNPSPPPSKAPSSHPAASTAAPSSDQELQQAIIDSGNDRAALVRNLESFLKKYPESRQRPQIYRALVETCLQLRDNPRAADYAERIVALNPQDISITVLAIQLLEQGGSEAALRRASNYASRVLVFLEHSDPADKSPKISQEEWAGQNRRDRMSILALRGRLELKLNDTATAQKDFESSYAVEPSPAAAEQLGEIAELKKDLNSAIQQYARAFALADAGGRRDIRRKLGNVWRLAHGSEDGLGEYLLRTYDAISMAPAGSKPERNAGARAVFHFTVRKAPEGTPFLLKDMKGKVLVLDFWTTWCGPCRALEPQFARVAAEFQGLSDVLFLAVNCDEDETLVPPYLANDNLRTSVVFADGLDRLFGVNAFPTVIVIDREGRIAYRSDGFDVDNFEQDLQSAVRRALSPADASKRKDGSVP